jgi:DNA-binding MarR family transcriptional regulator
MSTIPRRQHTVNSTDDGRGVRTPAGDAFSGLVVRSIRLNGLLAAEGDALARPAGQTSARWQVLAMVEDVPTTVAGTARTLGLARQSVQRVADSLEAAGLIVYLDNPNHRRARLVALTENGRATLTAIQAAQRPWADAIGAAIGERDLSRVNVVLDQVLEAVTASQVRRRSGRA